METSRLEIGRAKIRYLVPARHPAPLRVRDRLDGVVERELPRTLARAFDSWFSESDPSIWIIRELHVETAINVSAEPEQITRTLATQIAKNLGAIFQDENQDNVRHFASRAAYLASFLADLAFGTAKSQWYYQSFAGLNALPLSGALRTALCDNARIGKEALGLLALAELYKVVQSLTVQDAQLVLEQLAFEGLAGDEIRRREAVLRATTDYDTALVELGTEWQRALYSFIAKTHKTRGRSRDEDRSSKAGAGPDAQALVQRRSTAFGGTFLILPHLDELPLVEATRKWPDAEEAAAITLVRFLVLLKCCGSYNSERAFYDPLVRDLLLIPSMLSYETLRTWQSQLKRAHLENFLSTLLQWQRSRGAIGVKELLLSIAIRRPWSRLTVLIDAARGLWLWIDKDLSPKRQKVVHSFNAWLDMLAEEGGVLYSDPCVISLLHENFPQLNVIELANQMTEPAEMKKRDVSAIIGRLDKLAEELEFLRLPAPLRIARRLDLALSIVAQHLLRQVAYRLPGFAGSNLPYLFGNFFDFAANIEEEPARRVVRLGQPPLHLVLNMTGMNRQSYRLSWLDERPFALFHNE